MDRKYQDIHIYITNRYNEDYRLTTIRMVEIKSINIEDNVFRIIGINGMTKNQCNIIIPKVEGIKLLID